LIVFGGQYIILLPCRDFEELSYYSNVADSEIESLSAEKLFMR
jgi:hypothetical protein